jgi:transposase
MTTGGGGRYQAAKSKAQLRRVKALELRQQGLDYRQIAERLGCGIKTAWQDVQRALKEHATPIAEELRDLEGSRLDAAQKAIWGQVLAGDIGAVNAFIRLSERRSRLYGLDLTKANTIVIGGAIDQFVHEMGWTVESVLEVLRRAAQAIDVTPSAPVAAIDAPNEEAAS